MVVVCGRGGVNCSTGFIGSVGVMEVVEFADPRD